LRKSIPSSAPGAPSGYSQDKINWTDLAAFAAPCTVDSSGDCVNGHPGSEGRNALNSPNYTNFDFSLTKTSHLTKTMTMELRADFFNVFNHPNFSNPLLPGFGIDVFGSPTTSADRNRLLAGDSTHFLATTATPDVGSGNPYLGGGGPRSAQLAVHFIF